MNLCATGCGKKAHATLCPDCTGQVVTHLREIATGGVLRIRVHQRRVHVPAVTTPLPVVEVITPATVRYEQDLRTDTRPSLYELLVDTLTRRDHTGSDSIGAVSGASLHQVSFHEKAAELKDVIDTELSTWARDVAALNQVPMPARTVRSAAAWLAKHPTLIAAHPDAARLHGRLGQLVRMAHRVIDRDPDRIYLGQCGAAVDAATVCEADIYAQPNTPVVQCRRCGAVWDVAERRDYLLANVDEQLATPPEISRALTALGQPVTVNAIYGYAHRGKLTQHPPHPLDERRRPRYRVGDVRDILDTLNPEGPQL